MRFLCQRVSLSAILLLLAFAVAMLGATPKSHPAATQSSVQNSNSSATEEESLLEGERRFRTNCGRCHMAPHKFPPRMMTTIIRHMRVRATITDEDMRLILHYMTH